MLKDHLKIKVMKLKIQLTKALKQGKESSAKFQESQIIRIKGTTAILFNALNQNGLLIRILENRKKRKLSLNLN